jgi:ribosomal protein L37AE/L43A
MRTLRTEYNKLANVLERYDLTEYGDELDMALKNLKDKITEVEKRLECIDKTAIEIRTAIQKYTKSVDGNEAFIMDVEDHNAILIGTNDIDIATDLEDDEPIENNWYGLFQTKEESVETEKPMSVTEYVSTLGIQVEPTEDKVEHSLGGIPYRVCHECSIKEEENVMLQKNGFWLCNDCGEEPPTMLCTEEGKHKIVKDVIAKLKEIQVDGETMDYIVKELGFEEYLLRSLVMNADFKDTKDLLREKFVLSL